ncbi:phosphoglycerate mutase family protein [Tritrichomonas foetus]|uniref:Phosphoglycerate mutase family protein n=1 Tax=Tritrichomonas foetus TaxID=1144522 RepID=A0A1J4KL48_9EUKA|nr:phosphoglycerate mutase family protein [Tritrichomonas foetus]|eukprot:OHT10508.1 phosphoglycerate mutase family protein [Tritrichomonas foetus]
MLSFLHKNPKFLLRNFSKSLMLIRHGESIGNAKLPINCTYLEYPLTSLGEKQAKLIAESIKKRPSLIVSSPFKRALDTAKPLLVRFPNTVLSIDARLSAFEYLSSEYYTEKRYTRGEAIKQYWEAQDPFLVMGKNAESFSDFYNRTKSFFDWFENSKDINGLVVGFTHAMSLRMLEMHMNGKLPSDVKKAFLAYSENRKTRKIRNCEVVEWKIK